MKILVTTLSVALLATGFAATSANAARLVGADPDLLVSIAEREQRERLFLSGKVKSLHPDHANRLGNLELERWLKRNRNRSTSTNR